MGESEGKDMDMEEVKRVRAREGKRTEQVYGRECKYKGDGKTGQRYV